LRIPPPHQRCDFAEVYEDDKRETNMEEQAVQTNDPNSPEAIWAILRKTSRKFEEEMESLEKLKERQEKTERMIKRIGRQTGDRRRSIRSGAVRRYHETGNPRRFYSAEMVKKSAGITRRFSPFYINAAY
jgi:hypothetical protein